MPASVSLRHVSFTTPDNQPLFSGLDLTFGPRRTGLIGRNGTGKSTLLRLIAGELLPAGGTVAIEGSMAMLHQSVQVDDATTVADGLGIAADLERLARLEAGNGTRDDAALADWGLPQRLQTTLAQVGLPVVVADRPMASLSGGQRTRIALAGLLLAEPEIILLDEPTNNLDADGRAAVAQLLEHWSGCAIVASHDRDLLNQMDTIVELTSLGVETYSGNWDHYRAQKAVVLQAAQHDLAHAEQHLDAIARKTQMQAERKARRDGAGARKAARGDMPKILVGARKANAEQTSAENSRLAEKQREAAAAMLQNAGARIEVLTPLSARLASSRLPAGKTIVRCENLTGGPARYEPIIRDLTFSVIGPERIAITGANGAGKSSLLRLLAGELAPQSGTARILGHYRLLDQTASLLDPSLSVRDNFRRLNPDADENHARAALARFMFRADAALELAGNLSGGELLRAGLAIAIGGTTPPELLMLDEPTNHLDLTAIEALEAGLIGFDGALIVVSHDQQFLSTIGVTREIAL